MSVYFYIDEFIFSDREENEISCRSIQVDDIYWYGNDDDEKVFIEEVL